MKEKKPQNELDALIDAYLDGELTEEEANRLSQKIEQSSEARQRYWQLASVHGMIEQSMQNSSLKAATGEEYIAPVKRGKFSRWPRITAVAAGLVIGIFSTSLVWAFKIPHSKSPRQESREIVFESFEDPDLKLSGRFPATPGEWHGRILTVPQQEELPAVDGTRVGKFSKGPEPKFTYTRYIIDLEEQDKPDHEQRRSVEVKASFFPSNPEDASVFQIRLAAFSQAPEEVRPIWNDQTILFDTVLQHVGRNHITEPGQQSGWHQVRATIDVPADARSVVISLGAGMVDPETSTSEHYVDAIQVHLVDTIEPLGS